MDYYLIKKTPSKARRDTDRIMRDAGFRNIGLTKEAKQNTVLDFLFTCAGVLRAPFILKKGDRLLLPYNLRKYYLFLCRAAHLKGAVVITLIHDLSSFYRWHVSARKEIARLNHSDSLIAHNPAMKQWLAANGCRRPVAVLGIFDYLSGKEPAEKPLPGKPYKVLYAGTLSPQKNQFLYRLEEHIRSYRFNLYGKGFDEGSIRKKECFAYKGFLPSDDLVAASDGDFGLVWDGASITSCEGPRGEYMKYNNPHKCSLYIRCGLPLVIWEQAAMAPFVRQNKIGICIPSLTTLDSILSAITREEYAEMKNNVAAISRKLSEGHYFKSAYREAVAALGMDKEI